MRVANTNTAMGKALAAAMGVLPEDASGKNGGKGQSGKKAAQVSGDKNQNMSSGTPSAEGQGMQNGTQEMRSGSLDVSSGLGKRIRDKKQLAEELGIGEITLTDILKELEKPARDPRDDMPRPILRSDVLDMKDLKPGMILKGTVRNVIDFGVFVDIGVHQDGLVHISQITDRYIKHPLDAVSVGDIVEVQVLGVEEAKKRISLTMKINAKK